MYIRQSPGHSMLYHQLWSGFRLHPRTPQHINNNRYSLHLHQATAESHTVSLLVFIKRTVCVHSFNSVLKTYLPSISIWSFVWFFIFIWYSLINENPCGGHIYSWSIRLPGWTCFWQASQWSLTKLFWVNTVHYNDLWWLIFWQFTMMEIQVNHLIKWNKVCQDIVEMKH